MSTDPIPLAQRLTQASADALNKVGFVTWRLGPEVAGPAVVAVLWEVVNHVRSEAAISGSDGYDEGWDAAYEQIANDFEALADFIEKGGEANG